MNTLLNMTGITKAFSGVRVLDDVSFNLYRGEVHVLAGENGAGKSTLMKILSGVYDDYAGTISLDGRQVRFSTPHDAAKHGIAIIHQELSLINDMSVADNIFLGREQSFAGMWLKRKKQDEKARLALRRLGLDIDVRRPAGDFPVSVRQMIEIARALAFETRILIMDEPTSSLNDPEVARLFQLIQDIKHEYGIIYISHKMDEIYRLADRITVLRDGRHIATEAVENLSRNDLVKKVVGRELSEQFPPRRAKPGGAMLDVRGFSASPYPVNNVSFSARAGEIVGFAGLQGSGSSELFHGLFGAYGREVKGEIILNGKPYAPRSPSHAIRSRMVLLTNDRKHDGLIPRISAAKNITLASVKKTSPRGWMNHAEEKDIAERHRKSLNIRIASLDQEVSELSGGNQQKVVLAKWLETSPHVLLLDEPTRGVDVGAKHEIYEWMNRWTAEGATILLITSELPELLALSDRIFVMHRGGISAELSREEATQEKIVQAAM